MLLIACVLLGHFGVFGRISAANGSVFDWASLVAYIIAVIPVGMTIAVDCFRSWARGDFMNEFTLMLVAAVGAFFIGEYPEAVAVLLFYSFGEKLEDRASDDVRKRIRSLLGRLPDSVRVVETDGSTHEEKPGDVAVGTEFLVRPGERIPVDAILLGDRNADVDTSAITGESVPRGFAPGETLDSGMIPVDRELRLRSVRPFSDSSMSRIMKMIEEAQEAKSPTETMLRRITRWYTPAVLILAVLLFAVPWIVSLVPGASPFDWYVWFKRSLVFLVCSCPCALVVSVPLSYFASIGAASKHGLLFKGGKSIDAIRTVDTVAFDKTGTLTTGRFRVSAITPAAGTDADTLLGLAAAIDSSSSHPLARAICEETDSRQLSLPEVDEPSTVAHGMKSVAAGEEMLLGSRRLLQEHGVEIIDAADGAEEGVTEVFLARGGKYVGSISLLDEIKPEAAEAIQRLRRLGVKNVVVLSGDRKEAVDRVAKATGANTSHAALLPDDKHKIVAALEKEGHRVAFVGDGINDAPAIATATTGVAMGTAGTDIAMQSADVVIATDNLNRLADAISLSRRVRHVVTGNVVFALGVKALVMLLGALGIATLWAAVFADTGVTVITIIMTILMLSPRSGGLTKE